MKTLLGLLLAVLASGCARTGEWSVSEVREVPTDSGREVCVTVVAQKGSPRPMHLAVSTRDEAGRPVKGLSRWKMHAVSSNVFEFSSAELPRAATPGLLSLDLTISAPGYQDLHVRRALGGL